MKIAVQKSMVCWIHFSLILASFWEPKSFLSLSILVNKSVENMLENFIKILIDFGIDFVTFFSSFSIAFSVHLNAFLTLAENAAPHDLLENSRVDQGSQLLDLLYNTS